MIPFLDISSNNQHAGIDWPAVARYLLSIDPEAGVIVKATEGTYYVNPFLHPQRMGAHAAGLRNVGLYGFCRPSLNTGHAEADYLLKAIGNDGGLLGREFLCIDLEDTKVAPSADLDAYTLDYANRLSWPLGLSIIAYSGAWYTVPHNLNRDAKLADLGLWWAAPGSVQPSTPEPWLSAGKQILLWQHSWQGSVPGISGPVDLNWLIGPISRLTPFQWGLQPDPVAGRPAVGTSDVSLSADVPTILKHCLDLLKAPQPDLATLYADLAQAERIYGLQGA